MSWDIVIGLEVHVQLATQAKLFSGASTRFGASANSQASLVDLAMPGTLPIVNSKAIDYAIAFGLSVNANIHPASVFARKNYFYPDLPKGYQISQFDDPIVQGGSLTITLPDGSKKAIALTRAHLEEDAGKSIHDLYPGQTAIDLNRAGTPLLEVVSEPVMHSAQEAVAYAKALHNLVRCLKICDGNMQEGSFRCDVNLSLKPEGSTTLGTRTEIKNLNSFRFIEQAIHFESQRQQALLQQGLAISQETRLFDPNSGETRTMRSKEEAHDYRYFPDPDLLPVIVSAEHIERIRASLPELPDEKTARYHALGLSAHDAEQLANWPELSHFFDQALDSATGINPKLLANWVLNDLIAKVSQSPAGFTNLPVNAKKFAQLITRIEDGSLSSSGAKTVFAELWQNQNADVDNIIESKGLKQVNDSAALNAWIDAVISEFPEQAEDYRNGKSKLISFFVGQIMKRSQGRANPAAVTAALKQALDP
jgi:aspartyl-tRNA(Asn)/glutamyl-tRNA(Gln) amidotransferase subunit B